MFIPNIDERFRQTSDYSTGHFIFVSEVQNDKNTFHIKVVLLV